MGKVHLLIAQDTGWRIHCGITPVHDGEIVPLSLRHLVSCPGCQRWPQAAGRSTPALTRETLSGPSPGRRTPNATEARYEAWIRSQSQVLQVYYEPFPLYLGRSTLYWFDYCVIDQGGGISIVEVKGGRISDSRRHIVGIWRDDAKVKYKLAREKYGHVFRFQVAIAVPHRARAQYGDWMIQEG